MKALAILANGCFNAAVSFTKEIQILTSVDDPARVSEVVGTEVFDAINTAFEEFPEDRTAKELSICGRLRRSESLHLFGPDHEGLSVSRPLDSSVDERSVIVIASDTQYIYDLARAGEHFVRVHPPEIEPPTEPPEVLAAIEKLKAIGYLDESGNVIEQSEPMHARLAGNDLRDFGVAVSVALAHARSVADSLQESIRREEAILRSLTPIPSIRHARALGALISQSLPREQYIQSRTPRGNSPVN